MLIPHRTGCRSRKSIHPKYRPTGLYHIPSIESPLPSTTLTHCPFPIPVGYEVTWHKVDEVRNIRLRVGYVLRNHRKFSHGYWTGTAYKK